MICEIRTYRVSPGVLDDFVAAMREVLPTLSSYGIDVVACDRSLVADEGDHAYLIRAFESLSERDRLEVAFYGSSEWNDGARSRILGMIETYHTVVLDLPEEAVNALRH